MSSPLLRLEDVSVAFDAPVADEVSYSLAAGEVLAVVGESGSGKTVTAMSLLGLLPGGATVTGRALLAGRDLFTLSGEQLRAVRGNEIGMVFQEPMTALNPVFRVGDQLAEVVRAHDDRTAAQARQRVVELLSLVGLPADARRKYPHELSGGQLQRVVIAMAVANEPSLLIADEPTTALDVTVQAEVLELLRDLRGRLGAAILLITHDMGVVADLADRVVVMREGRVVEQGPVAEVFAAPRHEYTRSLLDSVISLSAPPPAEPAGAVEISPGVVARGAHVAVTSPGLSVPDRPGEDPVLALTGLTVAYGRFRAVEGIGLHIGRGEVLGLVGESGSGKSSIAGAVTGLIKPAAGAVSLAGQDLTRLRGRAAKRVRGRIGVVFQDPASSLNPRATIARSVAAPLLLHTSLRGAELARRVDELLDAVGLSASLRERYPHELSGGQRQRVGIARAIALDPELLIADEPTSALDVSVQARVLDLFRALQAELRFACLFISHDLAVVERLADRVAVLHRGRVVETGPAGDVLAEPLHPYTRRLLAAAPVADPARQRERRKAWLELQAP
ncbi:dipeptide ABC transporter ATP-binding protein [Saccharothrix coeruleofusca]|uniref:ABC transporter ATP-binding protein n=1 Tax=Saccharothrix coeruleofusca TaxID=33919 RepID=A0A918ASN1_9PSEU|nr:ABC transporter ATP-binding protein [Saccharothrix coeruleofusca]MBP2335558.1 peptide/nickel transport system ATP-binding protein [Saccharothrix coeruleofusca]GGP79779.1 ABC transporter ATP-binding protein [Saccharothrix coeruleofusca]